MKKLYAILFVTAIVAIGEHSNAAYVTRAGSQLLPTLRTAAPRYFSTGQQAVKSPAFSRAGSLRPQSRLFSTTPKTFTTGSVPKVGPSLSQQAASLARKYYKPAATVGAGALGTYLGSKYLTSRTPDMNIFRPFVAVAEEVDPIEQEFQEIEELIRRGEHNQAQRLFQLGNALIEIGDTSAHNKQRYIKLISEALNQQEEEFVNNLHDQLTHPKICVLKRFDGDKIERILEDDPNPSAIYKNLIYDLTENMIPNLHLARHPEELDVTKLTIPKGIVNALKRVSYEKGQGEKIMQEIAKQKEHLQNSDNLEDPFFKKRWALLNAIQELIEKDFPEKDGYVIYKPASSWTPWHWLGY